MLSPHANLRLLRRTSSSGFVYIAFLMLGIWRLAGFFPSQPPSWDAAHITRIYHDNATGIRIGMVLLLLGSMFYVPRTAMLAKLTAAVGGKPGILTFSQIIAGCTNVLLTAYPAGWWLTGSFRSPLGVIAPFYFVVISIIYASLADEDTDPIIPRWVGWFNVFFMLDLIPLNIIFFFKTVPFAWNGLFGFYLPFATFWIWFFLLKYMIRRSSHRLDDATTVSAASVKAA